MKNDGIPTMKLPIWRKMRKSSDYKKKNSSLIFHDTRIVSDDNNASVVTGVK